MYQQKGSSVGRCHLKNKTGSLFRHIMYQIKYSDEYGDCGFVLNQDRSVENIFTNGDCLHETGTIKKVYTRTFNPKTLSEATNEIMKALSIVFQMTDIPKQVHEQLTNIMSLPDPSFLQNCKLEGTFVNKFSNTINYFTFEYILCQKQFMKFFSKPQHSLTLTGYVSECD
jgi:hypothetical protein